MTAQWVLWSSITGRYFRHADCWVAEKDAQRFDTKADAERENRLHGFGWVVAIETSTANRLHDRAESW